MGSFCAMRRRSSARAEAVWYRFSDCSRYTDPVGVRQLLQALSEDHPGSGYRLICNDDFAKRDADTDFRCYPIVEFNIAFGIALLRRDCSEHGIRGT